MKSKSLKFKIITFAILSAIAAVLIVNSALKDNVKSNKSIEITNETDIKDNDSSEIKPQVLSGDEIEKQQQLKLKQEELEKKWQLGKDEFFQKNYEKAIDIQRQILKEDPTFYKAYAVEGIALAYNGSFEQGMQQIDKSLELKPDYGYARFNKALANELYGNYDEAILWYEQALKVEEFEWSYYGIASVYGRKGDVSNTVKYLKLAIDMNLSIKDVAKDEEDFDKVKESKEFKKLLYTSFK